MDQKVWLGRVGRTYRMEKNGSQATKEEASKTKQFIIYQQQVWPEHQTAWGWSPCSSEATPAPHSLHPEPRWQGQKVPSAPSPTRAPPELEKHLPWTEGVHGSLFSVPGVESMLPRAPQDFTSKPQMGLQSSSLLTWHLKVHTKIMCRKERSP